MWKRELSGLWVTCDTDNITTKTFKIQSETLNCNSQNVVHVLKYRKYGVGLYGGKTKSKFGARFDNGKSVYKLYRKKPESITQTFLYLLVQQSHNEIDAWQFALTEICETYDQCKEREHLSNTGIKHLTPVGFMKRKNIYIKSSFLTFL